MSRRWIVLGAAALTLALMWVVFRADPLLVDVANVERGPLEVTVDEEGETRVRDRYVVDAPSTGRLLRITLDEGDAVTRGTELARIEPVPLDARSLASARAVLEAAVANESAAQARVRLAEAERGQARRQRDRARRLREAGTLSAEAYEEAELAYTSTRQEYEAAQRTAEAAAYDVEAARATLIASTSPAPDADGDAPCSPCVEVLAPVAGTVLRVHEESERVVAAGTPLLTLGDPGGLEIVVDVLSTDAVRIRPGTPVRVEQWGGDAALAARVRQVEPAAFTKVSALGVEEQRVNVIADLLEPAPGLGDGFRVEARIVVWADADVLQVPSSALFRSGDAWSVFAVEAGRASRREVQIGPRGQRAAAIRSGLEEGALVILHPDDRLADGARVKPIAPDEAR